MNLLPPNSGTDPKSNNPNVGYAYVVPHTTAHPTANYNTGIAPSAAHFHPQAQFAAPAPQFPQQVNAINYQIQVNPIPNQFNPPIVKQQLPPQQQQFQGYHNFAQYQPFAAPAIQPLDPNIGAQIDIDQSNAQLDPAAFKAPSPICTVECTTSPPNPTSDAQFDDQSNNPQGQSDDPMGSILSGQHAQGLDGKSRSPKSNNQYARSPLSTGQLLQPSIATIDGGMINGGFAVPQSPPAFPGHPTPRPPSAIVPRGAAIQQMPQAASNQLDPRYVYGQLSHFIIEKKIGKGQFSVVYRARNVITNTITALKKVQVIHLLISFN